MEMTKAQFLSWKDWRHDVSSSLVVFLVALPLCLGIALASGAPLFSGVISGVIGGVVVGAVSKSSLSVSGPAAGLTIIVLSALQSLPSFEAFLLAVVLAGCMQIAFGALRAGIIGDFIPSSVIKGMLAAIGAILILKQIPHAIGYDKDFSGSLAFSQPDGHNTFSALFYQLDFVAPAAIFISGVSLAFLFWWDYMQPRLKGPLALLPGPLVVVFFGMAANAALQEVAPSFVLHGDQLVAVPVADSLQAFFAQFSFPDFGLIGHGTVWSVATTLAIVASLETLMSIEAIDKLDPFRRVTPTNRELMAQGVGNVACGLVGGLPVTSVIVRSSANVSAGGRTRLSTVLHGVLLFLSVAFLPTFLNMVPLAALAAILISVGYKLTKPAVFLQKYAKGWRNFAPFIVTFSSILLLDLLTGILIGVAVGAFFVIWQNFRSCLLTVADGSNYLVRCRQDLFFIHKYELRRTLDLIPGNSSVLIDLSRASFIDADNLEIIRDFLLAAKYKGITVKIKNNGDTMNDNDIRELCHAAA